MRQNDLTQGSVMGNIFSFALPYMFAYFLQILYGLADLFVIGRYCGVDSTTAVSNGAQVMHFVTVVIIGLAMGTTVRTALAVGAKDVRETARVVGNSATLFLAASVVLAAGLMLFTADIVRLLKAPAESVAGTESYLLVCFAGVPFIVAYNLIAAIFRGLGDTRTPMYFVAVACVVNIVLDFLFIGYFGLGPMGAALGTTLSQMVSVAFAAFAIRRHWERFQVTRHDLRPQRSVLSGILSIGVPVALQDGFIQVSFIVIAIIANMRGLDDAAAVGIVEKFIGLLFIVPSAMLSTVSAVSAQNIGAGKPERARQTLWRAIAVTFSFGMVCALAVQFVPELAVRIFTANERVVAQGADYLRSYAWDCALAGVHFCFSGYFTACGYSIISFCHNVASILTARVPLSYLFSVKFASTLYPMGWAAPIGSGVSVVICVVAYWWLMRRNRPKDNQPAAVGMH